MNRLPEKDLKNLFAEAIKTSLSENVAALLTDVSAALLDIQQLGIDVSLSLGKCSERHFYIFSGSASLSASGMLTIGNQDHLFAIASKKNEQDCLLIGLSILNMRHEGIYADISGSRIYPSLRAEIIDARNEDSIANLQKFILKQAGFQAAIQQADVSKTFKNQPHLFRK